LWRLVGIDVGGNNHDLFVVGHLANHLPLCSGVVRTVDHSCEDRDQNEDIRRREIKLHQPCRTGNGRGVVSFATLAIGLGQSTKDAAADLHADNHGVRQRRRE
jgi:hypothetical protein